MDAGVVRVSTELPLAAIDVGRNQPFTPEGNVLPLRLTVPVKPWRAVTVTL